MPRAVCDAAYGWIARNRYRFSIAVRHPWAGLLFSYRGALAVPPASPDGREGVTPA